MAKPLDILIIETSAVIYEGISGILNKSGLSAHVMHIANLYDAEKFIISKKVCIAIINPSFVQNNVKVLNTFKCEYPNIKWIAFIYAYFDSQLISLFDGVINISDSPDSIIAILKRVSVNDTDSDSGANTESLSERETEVLQLMATGLPNKEIADRLRISINTVITHRKNISLKTGIKSISGLTIYAVAKKLISLDSIP